jgi:hypothetical protein
MIILTRIIRYLAYATLAGMSLCLAGAFALDLIGI